MATKRGGSDLNHDNWDQEDEPEEQGTFKKASETELKARVIRKPKRRNAGGGEEAKNAFAGFGGFAGAAAKPASDAFGFLAKKSGDESSNSSSSQVFGGATGNSDSPKPSFVFGSASLGSSATKPAASTFSFGAGAAPAAKATFSFSSGASDEKKESGFGSAFGSTSSAEKKEPTPSVFGNAAFGSKNSDEKKDSPKSGFGSAFGSFASKPVEDKKEDVKVDDDLMAKFKPKGWSCDACMVDNDTSKDKCISCETPKPGSKPAAAASQPAEKTTMSFGKEGGFSFQATSSQTPAAGSGFTFGETKAQEKAPVGGGFKFGKTAEATDGGEVTPVKTTTETNNKSCETPVNKEYLGHLKALNIQVTEWIKKHVDDNPLVILSPVFKDYEKHLKSISEKYGGPTPAKPSAQPAAPSPSSQPTPSLGSTAFGAKTNDDLMSKFKPKVGSWSCDSCMVSNAPDKESCVSCETPKPGCKPKEPEAPAATSTFSFGKSGGFSFAGAKDSSSDPPKSGFSFGSTSNADKPPATGGFSLASSTANPPAAAAAATTGGFSFASKAADASKPFSFNASSPFSFAKSAGAPAPAATKAEEDDEEDKPPVVEVNAVTEEDSVYSKKCKLFYKKDGAYIEKGVGMLHLKPTDNDKTQLLIRADTNLGNILLNILLSPQIPTTRVGKNNVMLVCIPNPPIDAKSDEDSGPTPMLIRVKNAEDADELKAKVDELKEK